MIASFFYKKYINIIKVIVKKFFHIDKKANLFCTILSITLVSFSSLCSANDDVFTVYDITVNAKARTSSQARSEGIERAQEKALSQLFERLVPSDYHIKIPNLSRKDVIDHVMDFSVYNEKSSSSRYSANLVVRFQPEKIRSTLRFSNIPFAEAISKPVIIIPLYHPSIVSDPILWANPNPWSQAWVSLNKEKSLVERLLPYADLEDMTGLNIEDIVTIDNKRINSWARRYNTDNIVIASAFIMAGEENSSLRIELYFVKDSYEIIIDFLDSKNNNLNELFMDAVKKSWISIEDRWRNKNVLQYNVTGKIMVNVQLTSLKKWHVLEKKIGGVPLVEKINLSSITKNIAEISIDFLGNQEQLIIALSENDIELFQQKNSWYLKEKL